LPAIVPLCGTQAREVGKKRKTLIPLRGNRHSEAWGKVGPYDPKSSNANSQGAFPAGGGLALSQFLQETEKSNNSTNPVNPVEKNQRALFESDRTNCPAKLPSWGRWL